MLQVWGGMGAMRGLLEENTNENNLAQKRNKRTDVQVIAHYCNCIVQRQEPVLQNGRRLQAMTHLAQPSRLAVSYFHLAL
jgi:aminoglycoside phosphotransferase family enzyme